MIRKATVNIRKIYDASHINIIIWELIVRVDELSGKHCRHGQLNEIRTCYIKPARRREERRQNISTHVRFMTRHYQVNYHELRLRVKEPMRSYLNNDIQHVSRGEYKVVFLCEGNTNPT